LKLDPNYVCGFVDGEGCFTVSLSKHNSLKRRIEVRAMFEIELRADDYKILSDIQETLNCGKIYDLNYLKYGWQPHKKLKVSNITDLSQKLIPFFDKYQLRAKKKHVYMIFRKIVSKIANKEHLTEKGFAQIIHLREQIQTLNSNSSRNR
jgi:hypothetical protein